MHSALDNGRICGANRPRYRPAAFLNRNYGRWAPQNADDHTLYSVNPAVPYPLKNEQNSLVIRGRVLGVVASSDPCVGLCPLTTAEPRVGIPLHADLTALSRSLGLPALVLHASSYPLSQYNPLIEGWKKVGRRPEITDPRTRQRLVSGIGI